MSKHNELHVYNEGSKNRLQKSIKKYYNLQMSWIFIDSRWRHWNWSTVT